MNVEIFNFYLPTKIVSGPNSVTLSSEEVKKLGCKNALLITDKGVQETGIVDKVIDSLQTAGLTYAVFNEVVADPRESTVEAALSVYKENKCDGIISVGGGSSMDTAKGVGVLATNGGSIKDYEGAMKVKDPLPPLVCIPTTHGTGSEVSNGLVVTDEERKFKYVVGSPLICPKVAILDPALMVNLPPQIAASTGMDALCHAIGAFLSTRTQPFSQALALHAIRLISKNLRKAVATDDLEATYNTVIASTMAMAAGMFTRVLSDHAMGHALGSHLHLPHGLACGLMLPYVMEFNAIACPEELAIIAQAMGERIEGLSATEAAQRSVEAVRMLCKDIGIPEKLTELGVTKDDIPRLAEGTVMGNVETNPRRTTLEDVVRTFEAAL